MVQATDRRRIVMNFSTPPGQEEVHDVAVSVLDNLPDDIAQYSEDLELVVEEFATQAILDELDVENEFDLLAIYQGQAEKMPGVVAKNKVEARRLTPYRRPILDLWCDTGEDLMALVRNVVISEIAQGNGYSDEEIEAMCAAAASAAAL